jgi:hypothetical protein
VPSLSACASKHLSNFYFLPESPITGGDWAFFIFNWREFFIFKVLLHHF